jgi:sugar O-acyltransferase (sialic acid O-acetyltransferase NeuD family)
MGKGIYIIGAGGHARSIAEIATAAGFTIVAFVSPSATNPDLLGVELLETLPADIAERSESIGIAIGTNYVREQVWAGLNKTLDFDRFPALIHPTASIATSASIGAGTTIHQNSVVGPGTQIGNFCTVNTSSSIDHDCTMQDFSSLGPGAHTGGGVIIGQRSHVSIGAIISHNVHIGRDTIVGAGSCAIESLPDCVISVGTPSRILKSREPHETYL